MHTIVLVILLFLSTVAKAEAPASRPHSDHGQLEHEAPASRPHGDDGQHAHEAGAAGPHDATVRHPFDDVAKWSTIFDDPGRDAWQKPAQLVRALGLKPGQSVADLGAGTGYFLKYLSEAVGEKGIVWGLDIEPKMVAHMTERAAKAGWKNVRARTCPVDSPGLPRGSADLVLIADTWHHLDDRLAYLEKLASILTTGGRVAIVDFRKDVPPPPGPPQDHRIDRTFVISEFREAGWTLLEEPQLLENQYVLIFAPPR